MEIIKLRYIVQYVSNRSDHLMCADFISHETEVGSVGQYLRRHELEKKDLSYCFPAPCTDRDGLFSTVRGYVPKKSHHSM